MKRTLVALAMLLAALSVLPTGAFAQEPANPSQLRYVTEYARRDAALGPGCNGVGVAMPVAGAGPEQPDAAWLADHSACRRGLRLIASCAGQPVADRRYVVCTLLVAQGSLPLPLACQDLTLLGAAGRFTPDLAHSAELGLDGQVTPCTVVPYLTEGTAIGAVFELPGDAEIGETALTVRLDDSEYPAFLIPAVAGAPVSP